MSDEPSHRPGISRERHVLANLALAHTAIGVDLDSLARDFDRLSGDARKARIYSVAEKLAALGDQDHETRHALIALAEADPAPER